MRRWRVPGAGALGAIVLTAIYFMGFHQPRGDRIAESAADVTRLQSEQVTLRRSIAALEKVEASEPEFNSALRLLDQLIPSDLAQPSLLAHLQTAAQGAGVELVSVTFGDPDVPEGTPQNAVPGTVLVAMPVTVVLNGSFAGITDMLHRIESGKARAVLVRAVALTEDDAGFPQLTGTWSGQAYALLPAGDPLLGEPDALATGPTPTTTPDRTDP